MRSIPAACIVVLLVVPLFLAALCTIGVSSWALDRGLYASILSDTRLYEIPKAVEPREWWYPRWPGWVDSRGSPGLHELGEVPPKAATAALREVVTPAYARSQALRLLNESFNFIDGRSTALDPALDLAPLKQALLGEQGRRFAAAMAGALPAGPAGRPFIPAPGSLPRFRPADMSVSRAASLIEGSLPAFVKTVPDSLRLTDSPGPLLHTGVWGFWPGFSALRALVMADVILLVIAAGFWVLAGFTGGRDVRGRLLWLGWSLFAPAVLVLLIGLAVRIGLVQEAISFGIREARLETAGFTAGFVQGVLDTARMVIGRVATGFLAAGAIAGGVAMGLLAWAWGTPREERGQA